MAEDEYLTLEEVARLLKVPLETVRTWRKRRPDFPGGRVGRHVRVEQLQIPRTPSSAAWRSALGRRCATSAVLRVCDDGHRGEGDQRQRALHVLRHGISAGRPILRRAR